MIASLGGWRRRASDRLPAVVLTHNHADHIRGIFKLVESFAGRIGKLYYLIDQPPAGIPYWLPVQCAGYERRRSRRRRGYAPKTGRGRQPASPLSPGDWTAFNSIAFTRRRSSSRPWPRTLLLRAPTREPVIPNAASAVIRLARSSTSNQTLALFGGDLTFLGWKRLREQKRVLRAEVLVVPHHGSMTGAVDDFGPQQLAEAVQPRFALISVGTSNSYGHPRAELVLELRAVGATILCTQITGRCVEGP